MKPLPITPRKIFHHPAAFTLVELLVTLIIVAILIALLITGWKIILQKAQGIVCAGNMRSVGSALMSYRSDHGGWFPPGHSPATGGGGSLSFKDNLVPDYMSVLPVCPAANRRMSPQDWNDFKSVKGWFQDNGSTYGINTVLTQWRMEVMPWYSWRSKGWPLDAYSPNRMPFVLETNAGDNIVHTLSPHLDYVLDGHPTLRTYPRSHGGEDANGKGDSMNILLLDGHMEVIRRGKGWLYNATTNPQGAFDTQGRYGRIISPNYMSSNDIRDAYGL